MGLVRTQGPFQSASAASHPFTVSATTVGEWLVAVFSMKTATVSMGSVAGGGGTWSRIGSPGLVAGSTTRVEIWECRDAVSSTTTITGTLATSSVAVTMTLLEISDGDALVSADSANGGDSVSDTSWNGGTLTPAAGDWLLVSAATPNATSTSRTITAVSAGWDTPLWIAPSTTLHMTAVTTRLVTADGSTAYANTFTANGSQTNGYQLVAIPLDAGTPPPPPGARAWAVIVGL